MRKGFIPLYREWVLDPEHWLAPTENDPACRGFAWMFLCALAQHDDGHYQKGQKLARGEFVASIRWLARRFCWHRSKTHRYIEGLKIETAIETLRETPIGTVYRIVNYDTYAVLDNDERDTYRDTQRDTSETAARQEQPYNHKTITLSNASGFAAEPPRLPITVGEKADAKGIDLSLEWEAFKGHHQLRNTHFSDDGAIRGAWSKWVVQAIGFQKQPRNDTTDKWAGF